VILSSSNQRGIAREGKKYKEKGKLTSSSTQREPMMRLKEKINK
jgi:hypothetical protein